MQETDDPSAVARPIGTALTQRIDHVGVIVADIDAAIDHFASRFGLSRSTDWTEPSGSFRLVYLRSGDTTLQLVQPLRDGPLASHLQTNGEGLHHICFSVADLDQATTTLGTPMQGPAYLSGQGVRVCFIDERVHGVLIELSEPAPTESDAAKTE